MEQIPKPRITRAKRRCLLPTGFALLELIFAMGVLAVVAAGAFVGLSRANEFAAIQRNQSAAKALCQERIEQVLKMPFNPPTVLPQVNDRNGNPLHILGRVDQPWPPPSGTGVQWPSPIAGKETSRESVALGNAVPLYVDPDDNSIITATRFTAMERIDVALNVVRFTVHVDYLYRGQNYSCEMHTLRAPGKGD